LQKDGNLWIYDSKGKATWCSAEDNWSTYPSSFKIYFCSKINNLKWFLPRPIIVNVLAQ
jgi:hypothetical protein